MDVQRSREPLILIWSQQAKEHQIMVGTICCHYTGANGERRWQWMLRIHLKLGVGVNFAQRLFPFLILFIQTGITELMANNVSFTLPLIDRLFILLNINQCREAKRKEWNNDQKWYHYWLTLSNCYAIVTWILWGLLHNWLTTCPTKKKPSARRACYI